MNKWSTSSEEKLATCHDDLITLANTVLPIHDCTVVWGHRTEAQQEKMFAEGKSKLHYPKSKHNIYPSHAIDLVPYVPDLGGPTWDYEYSLYFAGLVLGVADMLYLKGEMQHKIRWGGNWSTNRQKNFKKVSFYDGLHFELVI